jgi:IPT/TIG domain
VTTSAPAAQGLAVWASYLLAAACLLVFLLVLWAVCGMKSYGPAQGQPAGVGGQTRRRFWYIFLGADDRVSTSKVQFAFWTLALAYALLVIGFHDAVFRSGTLDPRYLLLLGLPAGAAVSAKAITVGQKARGTVSKDPPKFERKTPATAVKDIVANDQGDLDLGDTQYFLFTLVALAAFFIAFFRDPTKLPVLPDTLVGLTSVSAAAYVAKKAVSPAPVKITAVSPQKGSAATIVKVFGSGFSNASSGDDEPPDVTFGGLAAGVQGNWTDTVLYVTLPPTLPPGTADVQVTTADGRTAALPNAFEVSDASESAPDSRPTIRSTATGEAEPLASPISIGPVVYQKYWAKLAGLLTLERLLIGVLAIAAMMIGLTPAALALHRGWLIPYLLIGSVVILGLANYGLGVFNSTRPTIPEFLLAELNAAVLPALLGIVWLVLYWAVFWAARLINHAHDQPIALALSLAFVAAAGVGVIWSVTRDLATSLYPQWGGNRTRYFYMTLRPRTAVTVALGTLMLVLAVSAAALITSSWTSTAVWVVILLFLVVAGLAVEPLPPRSATEGPRPEDVQAVGEALAKQGYRVVAHPRTGKPDVDPLVQPLELFSYSEQRAYAVEIKHGPPNVGPFDWTNGTSVLDAARALERAKLTETSAHIWPLLVVFDGAADESLRAFCEGQNVSLIRIERTTNTAEVISHDRSDDLQAIADRLVSFAGSENKPEGPGAPAGRSHGGGPAGAHLG